ncbi:MAG TPA: S-layer homology domain-containing protein [Chloroflexia bacterium]|nr:S-layer homology domain-containing protein [Chloroflexia bacterium]
MSQRPIPPGAIALGPGDYQVAQIKNDIVVWEDTRTNPGGNNWNIYAKDLATGVAFDVATTGLSERNPAIDSNLVVWQQRSPVGDWDIYASYISNDVAGPPFAIYAGPGDQTNPDVSGTHVVWQSIIPTPTPGARPEAPGGIGRWDILGAEAGQPGSVFTMTDATADNTNPAVDGDVVVWQSKVPGTSPGGIGRWDILGYVYSTGMTMTVNADLNDKTNPAIDNGKVVWQEFETPTLTLAGAPTGIGRWDLLGKDLNTGGVISPTQDAGDKVNPDISGDIIVYQNYEAPTAGRPLGIGRWDVRTVSINTGITSTISQAPSDATLPAIDGGTIVWQQLSASGHPQIYGNICNNSFTDVFPPDYYFGPVRWLSCGGVFSGYADGTFRPYANTTRGQLAKMIVLGQGWLQDTITGPHFADVPATHPFYYYVEVAYNHGVISGYNCGGTGEPCDPNNRPYFRAGANITRGQLTKIIVGARGWPINTTGGPHFADVPPTSPFYPFIETAANRGIISGYQCGSPNEPCDPNSRPYFRVGSYATRGQIAKILFGALQQ